VDPDLSTSPNQFPDLGLSITGKGLSVKSSSAFKRDNPKNVTKLLMDRKLEIFHYQVYHTGAFMDISAAIHDPELGYIPFTVERITYTRSRAGTTSRTVTAPAAGCIHPGTPEMIRLF